MKRNDWIPDIFRSRNQRIPHVWGIKRTLKARTTGSTELSFPGMKDIVRGVRCRKKIRHSFWEMVSVRCQLHTQVDMLRT